MNDLQLLLNEVEEERSKYLLYNKDGKPVKMRDGLALYEQLLFDSLTVQRSLLTKAIKAKAIIDGK